MSSSSPPSQIVEHIVLFKVKDNVDSGKIYTMVNDLNKLATIDKVLYLYASPIHRLKSASSSGFTHVLHSRYKTKEDLNAYVDHPDHLRVVEETMPIWEDILAVDYIADQVPGTLTPPPRSAARVTLLKVRENVPEEAKKEIVEAIKEKSSPGIDQITVGENFTPVRAKGFSIASVAYFTGLGEMEPHEELVKGKVGEYLEDSIVVDFVLPS
ncbi:hypothetical protein EUTSA_v10011777mg [Eutrema salsugineum]|uniref:Stress-response A/B barrel domain-containing protein n=1 Tax=Eutrema salsugineum TaxID=72664 RepID=V4KK96_EUTSA|nr:stress-response A/B barrel domain-containing protein UP3 [Eutrema salsugineum]ESQ30347.1 hypothetical protein EUTSA_v10011777mg [Eutrema salsugineum]